MFTFIKETPKPYIAFKVLAAGRDCGTAEDARAALEFAYANIKEIDVVLVGMWQKYQDQVRQNTDVVREFLAEQKCRQDTPAGARVPRWATRSS